MSCSINSEMLHWIINLGWKQLCKPIFQQSGLISLHHAMQPGKAEVFQIHMTVGGDCLDAYQDVRSPAVGVIDTKLHLNSVISDAHLGARYCTGDLKGLFNINFQLLSFRNLFEVVLSLDGCSRSHSVMLPDNLLY
jgi:hypothetical protein